LGGAILDEHPEIMRGRISNRRRQRGLMRMLSMIMAVIALLIWLAIISAIMQGWFGAYF
jgi:hypothetical protein